MTAWEYTLRPIFLGSSLWVMRRTPLDDGAGIHIQINIIGKATNSIYTHGYIDSSLKKPRFFIVPFASHLPNVHPKPPIGTSENWFLFDAVIDNSLQVKWKERKLTCSRKNLFRKLK